MQDCIAHSAHLLCQTFCSHSVGNIKPKLKWFFKPKFKWFFKPKLKPKFSIASLLGGLGEALLVERGDEDDLAVAPDHRRAHRAAQRPRPGTDRGRPATARVVLQQRRVALVGAAGGQFNTVASSYFVVEQFNMCSNQGLAIVALFRLILAIILVLYS